MALNIEPNNLDALADAFNVLRLEEADSEENSESETSPIVGAPEYLGKGASGSVFVDPNNDKQVIKVYSHTYESIIEEYNYKLLYGPSIFNLVKRSNQNTLIFERGQKELSEPLTDGSPIKNPLGQIQLLLAYGKFIAANNLANIDVRPPNILFDDNGYIKFIDLGAVTRIGFASKFSAYPGYKESTSRYEVFEAAMVYMIGINAMMILTGEYLNKYFVDTANFPNIYSVDIDIDYESIPIAYRDFIIDLTHPNVLARPTASQAYDKWVQIISNDPQYQQDPYIDNVIQGLTVKQYTKTLSELRGTTKIPEDARKNAVVRIFDLLKNTYAFELVTPILNCFSVLISRGVETDRAVILSMFFTIYYGSDLREDLKGVSGYGDFTTLIMNAKYNPEQVNQIIIEELDTLIDIEYPSNLAYFPKAAPTTVALQYLKYSRPKFVGVVSTPIPKSVPEKEPKDIYILRDDSNSFNLKLTMYEYTYLRYIRQLFQEYVDDIGFYIDTALKDPVTEDYIIESEQNIAENYQKHLVFTDLVWPKLKLSYKDRAIPLYTQQDINILFLLLKAFNWEDKLKDILVTSWSGDVYELELS